MNKEEGTMYFNLPDDEFKAVCEIANTEDITLGQALAMLISVGLKNIKFLATDDSSDMRCDPTDRAGIDEA